MCLIDTLTNCFHFLFSGKKHSTLFMNGPSFLEKTCLVGILKKEDLSFPTLKQLSSYMHTTKSRGIVYYGNFRENIGLLWSE